MSRMRLLPQASAIPYRFLPGSVEYLLITSQRGNWIFPKGIIDPGETPTQTALKEALEEAGLLGRIEGPALGRYSYQKWGARLTVEVFLLQVEKEEADWLESGARERAWFSFEEARQALKKKKLIRMLELAQAALLSTDRGSRGSSGRGTSAPA
jgi:phosphohistidine phosphatase